MVTNVAEGFLKFMGPDKIMNKIAKFAGNKKFYLKNCNKLSNHALICSLLFRYGVRDCFFFCQFFSEKMLAVVSQ